MICAFKSTKNDIISRIVTNAFITKSTPGPKTNNKTIKAIEILTATLVSNLTSFQNSLVKIFFSSLYLSISAVMKGDIASPTTATKMLYKIILIKLPLSFYLQFGLLLNINDSNGLFHLVYQYSFLFIGST